MNLLFAQKNLDFLMKIINKLYLECEELKLHAYYRKLARK